MRNRAKCKLCGDVIESYYPADHITCSCGEIGIWGGKLELHTFANDYANFLRVEDDESLVAVKYIADSKDKTSDEKQHPEEDGQLSINPLEQLKAFADYLRSMPNGAQYSPVTHADLASTIELVAAELSSLRDAIKSF